MSLKAMVLAAGLGERLRPATLKRPKPLIPLLNRPILYHVFDLLCRFNIMDVVINTHHLSDYFVSYLHSHPHKFIRPMISYEERILGTGGGIKKVQDFFSDNFLVINGDIVAHVDLRQIIQFHQRENGLATLALMRSDYAPRVKIYKDNRIASISGANKPGLLTYIGIQIINKRVFDYIEADGFVDIMDVYRDLMHSGAERLYGCIVNPTYWWDIGTIDKYLESTKYLVHNFCWIEPHLLDESIGKPSYGFGLANPLFLGEGSVLGEGVRIEGFAVVGRNCVIGRGAVIKNSILWDQVRIESDSMIQECVLTDGATVEGIHRGEVI